jgi:hypothetical protein
MDNLAILDRFSHGAYGSRLSWADIDDVLRSARADRDRELGVPEAHE